METGRCGANVTKHVGKEIKPDLDFVTILNRLVLVPYVMEVTHNPNHVLFNPVLVYSLLIYFTISFHTSITERFRTYKLIY